MFRGRDAAATSADHEGVPMQSNVQQNEIDLSGLSAADLKALGDRAVGQTLRELPRQRRGGDDEFARFDNSTMPPDDD
jgi:hypothetical protein